MKYNILFLTKDLEPGGVESVTVYLANAFCDIGHHVSIVLFNDIKNIMLKERLYESVSLHILSGYNGRKENISLLRNILIQEQTNIVINQYGLPFLPIRLINRAKKGLLLKTISVYHSDPITNARIINLDHKIAKSPPIEKKIWLMFQRSIYRFVTGRSMRYVYRHSDSYVLLSERFRKNFISFTKEKKDSKIVVIPNPITLDANNYTYNPTNKKNYVLYVGRIESVVKRVDRVVEVWSLLEKHYPDWQLYIVGDGDGLQAIKTIAKLKQLNNIHFEGFQDPKDYYEKASILLLTSDFEGFGLTLVEGMKFGVVPIAYGSYASVDDIIEDNYNGCIVRPIKGNFSAGAMCKKLELLMSDSSFRIKLAHNTINIEKKFDLSKIVKLWEQLFELMQQD